jgi:hypothetical protein
MKVLYSYLGEDLMEKHCEMLLSLQEHRK